MTEAGKRLVTPPIGSTEQLGDGWELVTIPLGPPLPGEKTRFYRISLNLAVGTGP